MSDVPCPHCGHGQPYKITTRNRLKCRRCLKQYSAKSASAFRWSKLPLEVIASIQKTLKEQPKASISGIARLYGLSYRGASSIIARIRQIEASQ